MNEMICEVFPWFDVVEIMKFVECSKLMLIFNKIQ
jgi:hypothetical protein